MNYNDLWNFAKNQNLYNHDDDDDNYVICVKKPKKRNIKEQNKMIKIIIYCAWFCSLYI